MVKKVKVIILLVTFSICLCLMSSTYSRYVANAQRDINASFSKWQILVNTDDITNGSTSTISITPTIIKNAHVAENVVAPTSEGFFDITVNPANVDVSFKYSIELAMENAYVPDLLITKYAILPDGFDEEEDSYILIPITEDGINNDMLYDRRDESFRFQSFTIRIFFEWYDGVEKTMTNEEQAVIGELAAKSGADFNISANLKFEQIIN